ncbi:hypothetical protein ACFW17_21880 [Streptomyces sp. NPDC058961]|uniref:hypothetical protein n=1 Tax=Streptomyces sp. NPDC058961 TaxID=3346680 RepID=UPI00369499DB
MGDKIAERRVRALDPNRPSWERQFQARESEAAYQRFRAWLALEKRTLADLHRVLAPTPWACGQARLADLRHAWQWERRAADWDSHRQRVEDESHLRDARRETHRLARLNAALALRSGIYLANQPNHALTLNDHRKLLVDGTRAHQQIVAEAVSPVTVNATATAAVSWSQEREEFMGRLTDRVARHPDGKTRADLVELLAELAQDEERPS